MYTEKVKTKTAPSAVFVFLLCHFRLMLFGVQFSALLPLLAGAAWTWIIAPYLARLYACAASLIGNDRYEVLLGGGLLRCLSREESIKVLDEENHLILKRRFKRLERTQTFLLLFDKGITLTIGAKIHRASQVLHGVEVFHPQCIDDLQHHHTHDVMHRFF
jgi:hypothetical protein